MSSPLVVQPIPGIGAIPTTAVVKNDRIGQLGAGYARPNRLSSFPYSGSDVIEYDATINRVRLCSMWVASEYSVDKFLLSMWGS